MEEKQAARLTEEDELELFEELPVRVQQAVARGDVKLADLFEMVTTGGDLELCPVCFKRPVRDPRFGMCATCHRKALNAVMQERLDEIEARREADALKQQICRDRRKLGLNPRLNRAPIEKSSEDYGGRQLGTSDEPLPLIACTVCGQPFRQHHDNDDTCSPCLELAEKRASNRDAYVA